MPKIMDTFGIIHMTITILLAIGSFWLLLRNHQWQKKVKSIENLGKWYDKRFEIYISTMGFIASIFNSGELTQEQLIAFVRNTKEKDFLFSDDVKNHIDEIYSNGCKYTACIEGLKIRHSEEERKTLVKEKFATLDWMSKQFDETKKLFSKYLKVE